MPEPGLGRATLRFTRVLQIVGESASVHPDGISFVSAAKCIKRPGHKACPGRIGVTWLLGDVHWNCTECDFGGTLFGWRGSYGDLRDFASEPKPDDHILALTDAEYDYLRDRCGLYPDQAAMLAGVEFIDGQLVMRAEFLLCAMIALGLIAETETMRPSRRRDFMRTLASKLVPSETPP